MIVMRCEICKHFRFPWYCEAFKDKPIPEEIYVDGFDHRKPYKGDNGIQFEPIEK